jgi:molecular chaperone GrpE (heat shock protein)
MAGGKTDELNEAGRGYLWNDELLRPARVRVAE